MCIPLSNAVCSNIVCIVAYRETSWSPLVCLLNWSHCAIDFSSSGTSEKSTYKLHHRWIGEIVDFVSPPDVLLPRHWMGSRTFFFLICRSDTALWVPFSSSLTRWWILISAHFSYPHILLSKVTDLLLPCVIAILLRFEVCSGQSFKWQCCLCAFHKKRNGRDRKRRIQCVVDRMTVHNSCYSEKRIIVLFFLLQVRSHCPINVLLCVVQSASIRKAQSRRGGRVLFMPPFSLSPLSLWAVLDELFSLSSPHRIFISPLPFDVSLLPSLLSSRIVRIKVTKPSLSRDWRRY